MTENNKLNELEAKMLKLKKMSEEMQSMLVGMESELTSLRKDQPASTPPPLTQVEIKPVAEPLATEPKPTSAPAELQENPSTEVLEAQNSADDGELPPPLTEVQIQEQQQTAQQGYTVSARKKKERQAGWLERYIGQNLMSAVGIIVLMLGVAFGVGYMIDQGLISPLVRILMAYTLGAALCGVALWTKKRHSNFSATLLSGGLGICYFTTYFATSYYELFGTTSALVVMLATTVIIVYAALKYKNQLIAIFGQVAAYAIPYLLNQEVAYSFDSVIYMCIINVGVLALVYFTQWKKLFIIALAFTWLILLRNSWQWMDFGDVFSNWLGGAAVFSFATFYIAYVLSLKRAKLKLKKWGAFVLVLNSSLFYLSFSILAFETEHANRHSIALLLFSAAMYFAFFFAGTRQKHKDQFLQDLNLYLGLSSIILVFGYLKLALNLGSIWMLLSALLLVLGCLRKNKIFKHMGYALSFASIIAFWIWQMWADASSASDVITKFWLNGSVLAVGLSAVVYIFYNKNYKRELTPSWDNGLATLYPILLSGVLFLVPYHSLEIWYDAVRWDSMSMFYDNPAVGINVHSDIILGLYSALFLALYIISASFWLRDKHIQKIGLYFGAVASVFLLSYNLYTLSELREFYVAFPAEPMSEYLIIRFVGLAILILMLVSLKFFRNRKLASKESGVYVPNEYVQVFLSVCTLWILCSELLSWLDVAYYPEQYGLALSLLCGVYAIALLIWGIVRKLKLIRYLGLAIFALIVIKLFVYDAGSLSTGAKIIAYIVTGVLLLLGSFLYNKFKSVINEK